MDSPGAQAFFFALRFLPSYLHRYWRLDSGRASAAIKHLANGFNQPVRNFVGIDFETSLGNGLFDFVHASYIDGGRCGHGGFDLLELGRKGRQFHFRPRL
jgi:hypothetical protein